MEVEISRGGGNGGEDGALPEATGWRSFSSHPRAPLGAIILLGLLVYLPVCGYRFQTMDDGLNVFENPHLIPFAWRNLLFFWQGAYQELYIPLTYGLWALLAGVSELFTFGSGAPLSPFLFHTVNLLLHLLNAVLVWRILRELGQEGWPAGLGALLFLLHPVQVEPVAWVSGLKDLGSGALALLALWRYLGWCQAGEAGPGVRLWLGVQSFLLFAAALLAKPATVVLPLVFLACGRIWYRRSGLRLGVELAPFFLAAAVMVVVARNVQTVRSWDFVPLLWQRLLVAGDAITFYLGKATLPLTLTADYGRTPQSVLARGTIWLTGPLAYLLALAVMVKGSRKLQLPAALFAIFLLPVAGLLTFHFQSISTVADRYLYLAMLGPALGVSLLASARRQKWVWAGLLILLALLAGKSVEQRSYWFDTLSLNDQILRVNPASWTAYLNRGIARREAKLFPGAVDDFNQVLRYTPTEGNVYNHLGIAYFNWGRYPEANAAYTKAIALDPKSAGARFNLALLYDTIGQEEEAVRYCQEAIALEAGHGRAYLTLGNALLKLGREPEAVKAFENAFARGVALPEVAYNLGGLYMKARQPRLAVEWYLRATELNPDFGRAYNDLTAVYLQFGQASEAMIYAGRAEALGALDPLLRAALAPGGQDKAGGQP